MTKESPAKVVIEINAKTFLFGLFLLIAVVLFIQLRDVVVGLFVSILASTALDPLVRKLEKLKFSRVTAVLSIYLVIIAILGTFIALVVPTLVMQTSNLINSLPLNGLANSLKPVEVNLQNLQIITNQLGSVLPIFKVVTSTFSSIITFFTFAVITFYILVERKNLPQYLNNFFPDKISRERASKVLSGIEFQLGSWVRGELTLMVIVGFMSFVGLTLLGVPYALPLAILAGLLEMIPNIGPTLSAIPAIAVPLLTGQNPILSVFVAALYILVQQLENNLIVPKVMQSAVGLRPLLTIILIIIGLKLGGISGALLAVPLFLVTKVFYVELIGPYLQKHNPVP